jgi:uncharacterized repeat protein (TIGR01451 family)
MGLTSAHPVTVDGLETEWITFGSGPNEDNMGHITRNGTGQGQFIWADATLDQRPVATAPLTHTREVDIRQVRVTGDETNLAVYVKLASVGQVNGALPGVDMPQIQVAVDTLAGGTNTLVAPASGPLTVAAPWEYLIQTDFEGLGSQLSLDGRTNTAPPLVHTGAISAPAGTAIIHSDTNTVEIQVPWTALGGLPAGPVHFTVVTLRTSGEASTDGGATNIFDTLTPSIPLGPTGVANTQAELQDGQINYAFSVNFDQLVPVSSATAGEPYSPLLVTEVGLYPSTGVQPDGSSQLQWVEITNVSGASLDAARVNQYKIGDAPQRASNEYMRRLPSVEIPAGQSIIIARNKAQFEGAYPGLDTARIHDSAGLTAATGWGSAAATLSLRATGLITETILDQLVLLDDSDTVADLVEYANALPARPYPDHNPVMVPAVPTATGIGLVPNVAIQRCPTSRDTNNRDTNNPDWVVVTTKAEQTPLAPCVVADVGVTVSGKQNIVVNVAQAVEEPYVINYTNSRLAAEGVQITNILPFAMQYKAGSTVGAAEPTVSTTGDGRTQLVWNIGTVPAASAGQITFTAVLPANAITTDSLHEASISTTTREVGSDLANNTFSLPISYTTEAAVDVAVIQTIVSSGNNASQLFPGGRVVYRVTYSNLGAKEATGITLTDAFPAGLTYVGNSRGFAADTSTAGQVKLTVPGTLAPTTGSGIVDIIFDINLSVSPNSVIGPNTVTIATTSTPEAVTANNTVASSPFAVGQPPVLPDLTVTTLVKSDANARPGGTIVYTVNYANIGLQGAQNVTLTSAFSPALEYLSNSQGLALSQSGSGQVTLALPALGPSSQGTVDITFRIKSNAVGGGKVSNTVTIASTSTEASVENNSSRSPETELLSGGFTVFLPITQR